MKQLIHRVLRIVRQEFQTKQIRLRLIAGTLVCLSANANAQWITQSPIPTNLDVRGIGAPSAQHLFIATDDNSFDESGSLFESTDGGISWVQRNVPVSLSDPFYGLYFLDSQNGWAYGNDNYRTTDGGTTWTQIPFLGSTYFMKFYTSSFGIATGNFGRYISRDGGLTWQISPNDMFAFDFINDQDGLGVSGTGIYMTTDGGVTFTAVQSGVAEAVSYLSSTVVTGIMDNNFIRSTDGGATWTIVSTASGKQRLLAVSADVVLAWGRTGTFPDFDDRIFRSSDGGQTWTDLGEIMNPDAYAAPFSFAVPDPQTIVATDGAGNMFRSGDAGVTWTQTFTSPGGLRPGYLSSAVPSFADALTGYYGYGAGFIIKTTDGGASWLQISSGSGQSLNDIDRFASGNLIAVGDNGTILTNDGGTSQWILQPAISQFKIKAVQVVSASEVVMVDEIGQVYMSADGGAGWTAATAVPPGLSPAEDIHFTTLLNGWVTGQGLSLHHTSDGGNTWNAVLDFQGAYVAVDVEGANIWAANVTGLYYRSTDNGNTWTAGFLPGSPYQIQDMDFFDANIGYAVGWGGQAYRSADGGVTWQALPTPNTDDQLTDLCLVGPNEFWVSTNNDKAYYSANGGQGWAVLDAGSSGFGNFSAITANAVGDAWMVGFQGFIEHFTGPPSPPLNQPPNASYNFDANGLTVDFTDTSTDLDGTIAAWSWSFGDGLFSSEQNPSHVYDTANTYIVQLKVTDDDGASDSTIRIITVQPNPGGIFGDFTEVTPLDSIFVTPQDEDFWVITTAPADYDGDGDLDIAVLGYYVVYNQSVEYRLLLLVNNGASTPTQWDFNYIDVPLGSLTAGSSDLAWGDVDGDGDMDLAVGTDGVTVIYRNDAGSLVLSDSNLPGYWEDNSQAEFDLRSISWSDFDNDGDFDILVPSVFVDSTFSFKTALMRNDGINGTGGTVFTEIEAGLTPTSHANSTWADFDHDLDLDLLLIHMAPNTEDGFIRRYRNDGNGVFTGEDILGSLTVEHGEAQWGDYDADGDLDILLAGTIKEADGTYNLALRIYRNDNESYVPIEVVPCVPCDGWFDLSAATWADYDSDGDMDILLAGNYNSGSEIEGRATIYTNDGNGVFTPSVSELPAPRASGDRGGTFSWLDIDGDGDLDYFIAGQYFVPGGNGLVEAQMHLYRNDSPGQNLAPSTPADLTATTQNDGTVLLSWAASADDHTPGIALTYDLDLFHDGTPVVIPQRLPEPGNVSAVTEWLLSDLPIGNYEWAIRAVDASYSGSAVTTGQFSIVDVSTDDQPGKIPGDFILKQNSPNPFNHVTTITFTIPKAGPVTLNVFNRVGVKVKTLVDEVKEVGTYVVTMDAKDLPAGVYFYRMQAGSFSETKKMTVFE